MAAPSNIVVAQGTLCLNDDISSNVSFTADNVEFDGTDAGSADVKVVAEDVSANLRHKWKKHGGDNHLTKSGGNFVAQVIYDGTEPINGGGGGGGGGGAGSFTVDQCIVTIHNPIGDETTDENLPGDHFLRKDCHE